MPSLLPSTAGLLMPLAAGAAVAVVVVTSGAHPPAAPTGLTAEADGRSTIELAWTAPVADDTRAAVTHYRLEWSADGADGSWEELATLGKDETAYVDENLDPGMTRYYRVFALSTYGDSDPSNTASATTASDDSTPS